MRSGLSIPSPGPLFTHCLLPQLLRASSSCLTTGAGSGPWKRASLRSKHTIRSCSGRDREDHGVEGALQQGLDPGRLSGGGDFLGLRVLQPEGPAQAELRGVGA